MYHVWGIREGYTGFWWGNLRGKRPLGRPRRRRGGNINIDHKDVVCGVMRWIVLAQDKDRWWALVNAVMNLRVP